MVGRLNRLVNIEFEVSFSECPEGPHHTYYGLKSGKLRVEFNVLAHLKPEVFFP